LQEESGRGAIDWWGGAGKRIFESTGIDTREVHYACGGGGEATGTIV